jgi:iron complex outermembrane receptor protein
MSTSMIINTNFRRPQSFRSALLAGFCLLLGVPVGPAMSQTVPGGAPVAANTPHKPGGKGVEEVVVTAQRRSERLQNVPISITALSGTARGRAGVTSTTDLNAVVPGLNFTTSVGAYGLPTIRGIGSTSTGPGIENPVATYIDGVYMVSPAGALMSLLDISQVAVLKGPQGTLFGRNATGGLIQIATLDPSTTPRYDLTGTIGDHAHSAENLYISGPLTDHLSANLAVSNEDLLEGFGHNLFNDEEVGAYQSTAARSKLQWKDDATQVTFSADYARYASSNPALRTIGLTATGGLTGGGPLDINSNVQPSVSVQQGGVSLQVRHDFANFQVLSITADRESSLDTLFDGDQTPISIPFTLQASRMPSTTIS